MRVEATVPPFPPRTVSRVRPAARRLVLLAALLAGFPRWVAALEQKRAEACTAWGHPVTEQVRDERGPGFSEALERAREAIPPRGSYLLRANAFGPGAATAIALRLELLPRTAYVLEAGEDPRGGFPPVSAVVSIAGDGDAPVVSPAPWPDPPRAEDGGRPDSGPGRRGP
jgi:hypothetical protein